MGQRLRLAMALVDDPDLLVLDEPTTGLDPNGARLMRRIITEENDRGATVFFSSHIMEQVEGVCDRVGVLQSGQLVAEDTVDALRGATGGELELSVTVEGPVDAVADAVRAADGVVSVAVEGSTVRASLRGSGAKGAAMNAVANTRARIVDFDLREKSLEAVFADLTEEVPA